jgi:hypothetical protein
LLVEKGLVDPVALDELIDAYENKTGPRSQCLELRMRIDHVARGLAQAD